MIVSDLQSNAVSTLQSSKKTSCQMTIQTGMERTCQSDIRHTNNAILEMAIADFFHCKNIPDRVVESTQFKQLLEKAKYVGSDFKIPHRKKIGGKTNDNYFFSYNFLSNQTLGELLDIIFRSVYNVNKTAIMTKAALFGLSWLGDGATIKKMPLINILVMCGIFFLSKSMLKSDILQKIFFLTFRKMVRFF